MEEEQEEDRGVREGKGVIVRYVKSREPCLFCPGIRQCSTCTVTLQGMLPFSRFFKCSTRVSWSVRCPMRSWRTSRLLHGRKP